MLRASAKSNFRNNMLSVQSLEFVATSEPTPTYIQGHLNILANRIAGISESKGFHEPPAKDVGVHAIAYLYMISEFIREFEQYRKDPTIEYDDPSPLDAKSFNKVKLLLVISEIIEAIDALDAGNEEHHREEIADTIIRLLDYCGMNQIDIDSEVSNKVKINEKRPHKHGHNF